MAAPKGNQNARLGKHSGVIIRLNVASTDLLHEYFAMQGNAEPSREDLQHAVYYALQQVYGKPLERDKAIIL